MASPREISFNTNNAYLYAHPRDGRLIMIETFINAGGTTNGGAGLP